MRLAWFTPLRPVTSGIADYSADVLPAIGAAHEVDVFVASPGERAWAPPPGVRVLDAHEFPWRTHRAPYDLIVYQVGNSWCHDYTWPYLFRYPGLVVLHDPHLHHARAWSLLRRRRQEDYRAEFAYCHPHVAPAAAEVGIAGFHGSIYYTWPMVRAVVTSARAVAVHNASVARDLLDAHPGLAVEEIRLGVTDSLDATRAGRGADLDPAAMAARRTALGRPVRQRHGIPPDAVLVAAYGGVTPEKRIDALLAAAAAVRPHCPDLHLLLVGQQARYYDVGPLVAALGLADRVTLTGFVPDEELPAYLGAADVAICLRWPTARETSGAWLRCASAGLPTVITDLAHQPHLASLDPRTWTVVHASPTLEAPPPVAVSIDILDEHHSLRLALGRLVADAPLRASLGKNARAWWAGRHTVAHMAAGYERAMAVAAARAAPDVPLPAHLRPDALEHARALAGELGIDLGLPAGRSR
jgi:glycosyltransferase involved in cell wall biosynthesis